MHPYASKYLENYAEKQTLDTRLLNELEPRRYALVVPAYKEDTTFIERLVNHSMAEQLLLICVVNEPESDRKNPINQQFIHALAERSNSTLNDADVNAFCIENLQVLLIPRLNESALPDKQGVGLARKLGADLACLLHCNGKVIEPWIFCSDADATLPESHFSVCAQSSTSAIYHPFEHESDDKVLLEATLIYEACLRYYRNQLHRAGSPYSFYSLGSAMTVSIKHYMQARGFPKRSGAEDFYLLNKLAKLGEVIEQGENVRITARISDRVPFGTGPAVKEIIAKRERNEAIHYYSPRIFQELKHVLESLPKLWSNRMHIGEVLLDTSAGALKEAGIETFLQSRFEQDKSLSQFTKQFHSWFDAFQTLKFVHRLQAIYGDVEIEALPHDLFYT